MLSKDWYYVSHDQILRVKSELNMRKRSKLFKTCTCIIGLSNLYYQKSGHKMKIEILI